MELMGYRRNACSLPGCGRITRTTMRLWRSATGRTCGQILVTAVTATPARVPLINALCKGALGQLLNHFLPTQKLVEKRRQGKRVTRVYGPARTPYERALTAKDVAVEKKAELTSLHHWQKKETEALRLLQCWKTG